MTDINIGKYNIKMDELFAYTFSCDKEQSISCAKRNQCCCNFFTPDTSLKKLNVLLISLI